MTALLSILFAINLIQGLGLFIVLILVAAFVFYAINNLVPEPMRRWATIVAVLLGIIVLILIVAWATGISDKIGV
jgi:uncharacterized membrane protein YoaK (UPF0700 family)